MKTLFLLISKITNQILSVIEKVGINIWFWLFVFANIFVKTYHLSSESLYGDEAYSIYYGQQTIKEIIPFFLKDQNPPLHISLLHFWMNVFGVSDVSAKMFSIVCSVLAGIVLFLFAKRFINKTTAILVSFLFLFSNSQQFYAIEVRPYALVQLFAISSFYIYFLLLDNPKIKHLISLFIINLLLFFTHYLTIFIFVVEFIGVLFYLRENRKTVIFFIISQVLLLLAVLPWLKFVFSNIPKTGKFWEHAPDWFEFRWYMKILSGNEFLFYALNLMVLFTMILLIVNKKWKCYLEGFKSNYYFIFLILYILPILLNLILAQFTPVFLTRYFLYSTFGLFLLLGYSFSFLNLKIVFKRIIVFILLIIILPSFKITQEREDDWKHIVPLIKRQQDKTTAILISAAYKFKEFSYYYDKNAFCDYRQSIRLLADQNVFYSVDDKWFGYKTRNYNPFQKIILVQSHNQFEDSLNSIPKFITDMGFEKCDFFEKVNIKYTVYARPGVDCNKVTEVKKLPNTNCDIFDKYLGVNNSNDTIIICKTSFEPHDTCKLAWGTTDEKCHSGKFSFRINNEIQYSPGMIYKAKEILKDKRRVKVHGFVNYQNGSKADLVVSIEKWHSVIFMNRVSALDSRKSENEWGEVSVSTLLPEIIPDDALFKIYFWNPTKANVYIDDITIQLY